jgi:CHAD domain-containing protein
MKHEKIVHGFIDCFKKLETSFQQAIDGFDADAIHTFRVEIKKMDALLSLLKNGRSRKGKLTIPKTLQKFYKLSGDVRSMQLQQKAIKKSIGEADAPEPGTYLDAVAAELTRKKKSARKLIRNEKLFKRTKKKMLGHLPDRIKKREIRQFVQKEADELAGLITNESLKDETIHEVRKTLKKLLYDHHYIKGNTGTAIPSAVLESNEFKDISSQIGDFHDAVVALFLLRRGIEQQALPEDERILLMNIGNEWEAEKELMKQRIVGELERIREVLHASEPVKQEPGTYNPV